MAGPWLFGSPALRHIHNMHTELALPTGPRVPKAVDAIVEVQEWKMLLRMLLRMLHLLQPATNRPWPGRELLIQIHIL